MKLVLFVLKNKEEGVEKKEGEGAARKPIRETFFGCCASAITPRASNTTAIRIDDRPAFFIAPPVLDVVYHADGNKEKAICSGRRREVVE
jgi:hypothetical protein